MLFTFFAHHYLLWHYTMAFKEIAHVSGNLLWFTFNFFSIKPLFRSLFSPWKRMTENKAKGFSFENLAGYFIVNTLSRLVGLLIRTAIITVGLIFIILLLALTALTYIFWIIAPALLLVSLLYGLVLIFI